MDKIEERLTQCFQVVFPSLTPEQIRQASLTTVEAWDSIAGINLLVVLEEEFGFSVNPDDLSELVSFASILDYVRGKQPSPVA